MPLSWSLNPSACGNRPLAAAQPLASVKPDALAVISLNKTMASFVNKQEHLVRRTQPSKQQPIQG